MSMIIMGFMKDFIEIRTKKGQRRDFGYAMLLCFLIYRCIYCCSIHLLYLVKLTQEKYSFRILVC